MRQGAGANYVGIVFRKADDWNSPALQCWEQASRSFEVRETDD